MSKVFFHLHIPKTAGSLFNQILKRNFEGRFLHENPYLSTQNYTKEDVLKMIEFYNFQAYAGHVFNLCNTPFVQHPDLTALSFVRDPIEKYFSYYFYQRSRPETRSDCAAKKFMLSDYIKWDIDNQPTKKTIDRDSGQVAWITNGAGINNSVRKLISQKRYLIFPSEKFYESCFTFNRIFPEDFTCNYKPYRTNVSKRDQEITEDLRRRVRMFSWIKEDIQFHQMALSNLENLIADLFNENYDFNKAFNSFKESCRSKGESTTKLGAKMKWKIRYWMNKL